MNKAKSRRRVEVLSMAQDRFQADIRIGFWLWLRGLFQQPYQSLGEWARSRPDGETVGIQAGSLRFALISDPDLVAQMLLHNEQIYQKGVGLQAARRVLGNGLLTSEGALHKLQRQLIQPVFQAQRVNAFSGPMADIVAGSLDSWPHHGQIDASQAMISLTLKVVGQCLFGSKVDDDIERVRQALGESSGLFRITNLPFFAKLERWFPPLRHRLEASKARLDAIVYRLIESQKAQPNTEPECLLRRMIRSEMSPQQLRDEAMTLFLAGHETTAHSLTFALYAISRQQELQTQLRTEVQQVLGTKFASEIPYSQWAELMQSGRFKLLSYTIDETLRLYPTAWIMGRQALEDHWLGNTWISKGCTILSSPFLIQRNPKYFVDPLRFWPERWSIYPRQNLPRFSYFPFGAGKRVCIGEHFAKLEMTIALASVLQKFRLDPCPVQNPKLHSRITLSAGQPLIIPIRRL
jgi:cytochrome P450